MCQVLNSFNIETSVITILQMAKLRPGKGKCMPQVTQLPRAGARIWSQPGGSERQVLSWLHGPSQYAVPATPVMGSLLPEEVLTGRRERS